MDISKGFEHYWKICESESHLRYPYYYDEPCVIDEKRTAELEHLQKLLYKCFNYFITHFEEYKHIVEYDSRAIEILNLCDLDSTRIGFYRPDLVFHENGDIKLCEIGARYYECYLGHGIPEFIMEKRSGCRNDINGQRITEIAFEKLNEWWDGVSSLTILRGRDREGDIRFYERYFERIGLEVHSFHPDAFNDSSDVVFGDAVLNCFSQKELYALTNDQIRLLLKSNCLNPLSTIMLLHDKRFLAVLWDDDFRSHSLDPSEDEWLKHRLIPTYTRKQDAKIWEMARLSKDNWILKPQLLGKSEGIVPGPLVNQETWEEIFKHSSLEEMVLQEWVPQRIFKGSIDGKYFNDFATGTMLCLENHFHGLGQFRMTSAPVANFIKDDRKMSPWHKSAAAKYNRPFISL